MSNEKQGQPAVNPNPSAPTAAEWRDEPFPYTDSDGRPYRVAVCGERKLFVGSEQTVKNAVSHHNASLRGQLHGEKESVAESVELPRQNELLPCPFCGHDNIRLKEDTFKFLWCSYCGGAMISTEESWLVERWNKRAGQSVSDGGSSGASRVSSPDSSASLREKEAKGFDLKTVEVLATDLADELWRRMLPHKLTLHEVKEIIGYHFGKVLGDKSERLAAGKEAAEPKSTSCKVFAPNNTTVSVYGLMLGIAPRSDPSYELIAVLSKANALELVQTLSAAHGLEPEAAEPNTHAIILAARAVIGL